MSRQKASATDGSILYLELNWPLVISLYLRAQAVHQRRNSKDGPKSGVAQHTISTVWQRYGEEKGLIAPPFSSVSNLRTFTLNFGLGSFRISAQSAV